ncbi:MAG: GDP-mannose 4,6-dehydratase, partial [Planctomycetota bacterium]
ASSSSVYGDCQDFPKTESRIGTPLSPYASSKRATELYANNFYKLHGLPTIGLRYFNVFGPRQRPDGPYAAVIPKFMYCLKKNVAPSIHGDGEQSRDFTYVANAVEANIRALCVPAEELFGETCNVACGKSFSVNDLFKHLCNIAGVQCSANYVGERQGDVRDSMADISKATEHLGYQGRFGFEDGLRATWQFFDGPASGTTREIESSG